MHEKIHFAAIAQVVPPLLWKANEYHSCTTTIIHSTQWIVYYTFIIIVVGKFLTSNQCQ